MNAIAASLLEHEALGDCMLFRGLTDEERSALGARAPTRAFGPGETIFLMGSPGDTMMVVLSGRVRISVSSPDGKELTLAIVRKGEMFGEIALLDCKERTAEATAMTACKLAILERREIFSFLEGHPGTLLRIVDVLCSRLRRTDQHIAELALLPVPARLAKALLRLANADSRSRTNIAQIKLSQRELGMIVGATRESINKYLRAWQSRGLVGMQRSFITILDRAALEQLAEMGQHQCNGYERSREKPRRLHAPTKQAHRFYQPQAARRSSERGPVRHDAKRDDGLLTGAPPR
jgi:CRP/FNR family transcriptional regulator, cyclic AMP receptor protein